LEYFLKRISTHYEIIIFTSAQKSYLDPIIQLLPCKELISHFLDRTYMTTHQKEPIKDLSVLNRPLSTILIIDDNTSNFKAQPQNGIRISQFKGEPEDFMLKVLTEILELMARQKPSDLPLALKQFKKNL
jgi:TFIIF-interacting CTD phosphatase-like protein